MHISMKVPHGTDRVAFLGPAERNLKMLREAYGVEVSARGASITIEGDRPVVLAARAVLDALAQSATTGATLARSQVLDLIARQPVGGGRSVGVDGDGGGGGRDGGGRDGGLDGGLDGEAEPAGPWDGRLTVFAGGKPVRPRTPNQTRYVEAIRDHDLVFGIGPAGTGKTYLAVAAAVHLLKTERVKRVVLARPAVEAGEKLGYLPGDLRAKVNPYLRPLFDALADMLDFSTLRRFMESDVVEVVPLAFMRGRTLNHAAVILDEAQNATRTQMKMFLTRMGQGSKMVVTGDATQIDLPDPTESGLIDAARRLARTPGVGWVTFDKGDVVRHALVQRIIEAYGEDDAEGSKPRRGGRRG